MTERGKETCELKLFFYRDPIDQQYFESTSHKCVRVVGYEINFTFSDRGPSGG